MVVIITAQESKPPFNSLQFEYSPLIGLECTSRRVLATSCASESHNRAKKRIITLFTYSMFSEWSSSDITLWFILCKWTVNTMYLPNCKNWNYNSENIAHHTGETVHYILKATSWPWYAKEWSNVVVDLKCQLYSDVASRKMPIAVPRYTSRKEGQIIGLWVNKCVGINQSQKTMVRVRRHGLLTWVSSCIPISSAFSVSRR